MKKNKKIQVLFWVLSLLGLLIAAAAFPEAVRQNLGFLWNPGVLWGFRILCVLAFGFLIIKWLTRKIPPLIGLKWIYGILFLPLVLLPVLRCYFKVPYIFCRACPSQCPWGLCRTFIFNSFILLNCSRKFWCAALCPFGTFQECQTQVSPRSFKLFPRLAAFSSYLILLLVTGMYFLTLFGSQWIKFFDLGRYAWVAVSVAVASMILGLSFFIPKFWCRCFCPVGTIAELTSSFRRSSETP